MFATYILLLLSAHAQVSRFDADTMAAVMAGTEPAFVKFDFPPCELCEALDPFWNQLGQAYPSLLYKVDCTRDRPVCEARSVAEVRGQPVFKFWTGSSFRRYSGEPQPKALVEYLQKKLTEEQMQALNQRSQQAEAERRAAEQAKQTQPLPTGAPAPMSEQEARYRLYVCLFAILVLCCWIYIFICYLRRHPREQPGTFVFVGTYTERLDHVDGRGDGLYLFRLHEADGSLTPVSCVGVGVANLSYLCAEPPRRIAGGWPGAYVLHAASERVPDGAGRRPDPTLAATRAGLLPRPPCQPPRRPAA